jgi:hypothetical protein
MLGGEAHKAENVRFATIWDKLSILTSLNRLLVERAKLEIILDPMSMSSTGLLPLRSLLRQPASSPSAVAAEIGSG